MGVNVSRSSGYDLLIVTDDLDHIKRYCILIKQFIAEALVGFTIKVTPIIDHENRRSSISCRKVVFLLDERTNSVRSRVPRWIRALSCCKDTKRGKYLIVNVDENVLTMRDGSMERIGETGHSYKVMTVSRLGSVFRWWPRFLKVILPNSQPVRDKTNLSYSKVYINEDGFGDVNDCDQTVHGGLYHFFQRQEQGFVNLFTLENFRTVNPDVRVLLINTDNDFHKATLGKCLRKQSKRTLVFLDRELDDDLLKGFEVDIFTPTQFMNGIYRLMIGFNAINVSNFVKIPTAPIGPLEAEKTRSSIIGNGLKVFVGLKWRGCILQNRATTSDRATLSIMIERFWVRNQKWTVVAKRIPVTQHRYEDRVSYNGEYRYRISCVNSWGTTSSAVTSDWVTL